MSTHDHTMEMTTGHMGMTTDGNGGMGDHKGHMKMYLHFGVDDIVLIYEWVPGSVGALVGYCFAFFFLAVFYEVLKYYREKMQQQNSRVASSWTAALTSGSHILQTGLHFLQLTISYILMLVVMTYNVWLCLAIIFGCAVGYFLFGWRKSSMGDLTENCH